MASLKQARFGSVVLQTLLAVIIVLAAVYLFFNAAANLQRSRIASGFGFLARESGFEISETTFLTYDAADTYLKALAVGVLNTLRISFLAIVCSTFLGTAIGLMRLSSNWLIANLAAVYVEMLRNVPLVVQLFFWYALITESLPAPAAALSPFPGLFLSNRGFAFPAVIFQAPLTLDYPVLNGFNFTGGALLSPEFTALFLGLSLYTAAFIAEIVRAGILAVDRGQSEAAHALGHSQAQVIRFIVVPQALRLMVPPLTSQYLNCMKNSSLAVAIGYPDLVSIVNTAINQTGQAIEGIAIIMAVYLTISLSVSALMNGYNRRLARRGRTS